MSKTVFDMVLSKEIPSWIIWEDENYIAFLTPFPSTPGTSVVIPKTNLGDYLFDLAEDQVAGLSIATQKVAKLLEKAFNVKRVALVVEGTGVPYVHAKLYPLHGKLGERTDLEATETEFHEEYMGHLSTLGGPKMADERLDEIRDKILKADTK